MNAQQQITRFHEFFEKFYYARILEAVQKGEEFIVIDFSKLSKFDPELAEDLIIQPEETLTAAQLSIAEFDLPKEIKQFHVRVKSLPESSKMLIRNVRSRHLTRMIWTNGVVRQKSDVRPQVTSARFECPSCGNVITVLQLEKKFREPSRCGCGRKGKFKELAKELIDAQGIVLEEASEDLEGGDQPKRINVFLKNDLVSPLNERRTSPGSKIRITGWIIEVPTNLKDGGKATKFDLLLQANYVETIEEDFTDISVTKDEEEKIRQLAADPQVYTKLINSIAPSIFGHERTKEALLLQFVGGVRKERSDGTVTRGDMHVLLVGDPGCGKSQLLKRSVKVAPKARYTGGKGASGAGLTAAVVKDEFLGGWSLEAGALVLSNRGFLMIDELDKMDNDDRAAMHEALEQQCYEYNTPIMFADGSERKIGKYVEELFKKYPEHVIRGKDCLILEDDLVQEKVLTTDWKTISQTPIVRVSKHVTTEKMRKIAFTNGRSIIVTPEHPVFVAENGRIITKRADSIIVGEPVPVPRVLPIAGEVQHFSTTQEEIYNPRALQHITVPAHNDASLYRMVGYLLSEGSKERNRGKLIGVNFTNKDEMLLEDFKSCAKQVFNVPCYAQQRIDDHEPRTMLRYISRELAVFFEKEMPELLKLAPEKQIPAKLMKGKCEDIAQLLLALFEGDGHVAVKTRTLRIGYGTNSRKLAEQIQDLLLRFGIMSSVTHFKETNKVNITGYENIKKFDRYIDFLNPVRKKKVEEYLSSKSPIRTYKEVVPVCGEEIIKLLKKCDIKFIGKTDIYTLKHQMIKRQQGISRLQLQVLVRLVKSKILNTEDARYVSFLENMAFGEVGFEKVKSVEEIKATHPWTYDVTIEPTHTFVSQAAILHNTVSISKANIQATLRAETTVLAAANPKLGRFSPREGIASQIDLPPTLINRFDLIFPIKDVPDRKRDEQMAQHILRLHKDPSLSEPEIPTELLRKFIAYARQRCVPKITEEALDELKSYYIEMRNAGENENEEFRVIPITARQLEALVRLAEASAKIRLSDKVLRQDARRAIELIQYCLEQVALDVKTGQIDIDQISTGISTTQRSRIIVVKELITELEPKYGKGIPIDDLIEEAKAHGVNREDVEEVIEKLKRQGDIFEPKPGVIQPI
jgi:replicative DNA helicase Mcm